MGKLIAGLMTCLALPLLAGAVMAQGARPGPEQEMLKKFVGHWDASVAFGGGESKGTAVYKMGLGGLWLELRFKGDFGGVPFEGRGVTGFDPNKKKYVGCWTDSMDSHLLLSEGTFDKEGNTLTEMSQSYDREGKLQKTKSVTEFKGHDTIVFTMYQVTDGKDEQMMQITYRRKEKEK